MCGCGSKKEPGHQCITITSKKLGMPDETTNLCFSPQPNKGSVIAEEAKETLWWRDDDPNWVNDLAPKFADKKPFLTFRLGQKWAKKLSAGDVVAICITNDPQNPTQRLIGYAKVVCLVEAKIRYLKKYYSSLIKRNIGAKTWKQAKKDMRKIPGYEGTTKNSVVSVIELVPIS